MHGLNTNQYNEYLTPSTHLNTTGTYNTAFTLYLGFDPYSLGNRLLPPDVLFGDREIWLKRAYSDTWFTQNTLNNCIMEITTLVFRLDSTISLTALLEEDSGIDVTWPYLSIFTGPTFRKYCKLLQQRRIVMKPGYPYKVRTPLQRAYFRKPITADTEGNSTYTYRSGTIVKVVRFYGVPQNLSNTLVTNQTDLSAIAIRGIRHYYCSYYDMADNTPTSTALGTVSYLPYTSSNVSYHPTLYNANSAGFSTVANPPAVYTLTAPP